MRPGIPLLLWGVFFVGTITANCQDSLVYFRDLKFNSSFERDAIFSYTVTKDGDAFKLMVSNGALLNDEQITKARADFYSLLDKINTGKFSNKKPEQKAKLVTAAIQKRYLLKYQPGSTFEDVLYNGNFSEVSGTATYCLAYEYLGIPYDIKDENSNTFVLACPGPKQLMVESTFQGISFRTFDNSFKKQFVETLKVQKLISEAEAAKSTTEQLFDKYYFRSNALLSLKSLAALQYYYMGQQQIESGNLPEAFRNLEKSYYLDPAPRTMYALMHTGTLGFQNMTVRDEKHAVHLGKLSRYQGVGITPEMIATEFQWVVNDLLFDRGNEDALRAYYEKFLSTCDTKDMEKEVTFVYYTEYGRYKSNETRYEEALTNFEQAFRVKPESQVSSSNFVRCLGLIANTGIPDDQFLKMLEGYTNNLPQLASNILFQTMLASAYLANAANKFENSNPTAGETYRKNFEDMLQANPELKPSSNLLGRTYSAAAVYYFRKGQTRKARELIEQGLKLAPGSYELQSRRRMLK